MSQRCALRYNCPPCGGDATLSADLKPNRDGRWGWFYWCWRCGPEHGHDFLAELARAIESAPWRLIDGDHTGLGEPRAGGNRLAPREPDILPSGRELVRWRLGLKDDAAARRYLRTERGLTSETVRAAGIGYGLGLRGWAWADHPAFMLPLRDSAGAVVNVKRRFWPDPPRFDGKAVKAWTLVGRGARLYPDVPSEGRLILCAGEMDALLTRQHGLPAVTATCGASLPDALVPALRPAGRRIAVVFDVGEEARAKAVAEKLRAAGAAAWAVALPLPRKGDDLTDWWMTYGCTAAELRALIAVAEPRHNLPRAG